MNRDLKILARARGDVNAIYDWLESRSMQGALSWYRLYWSAISKIIEQADSYPIADEAYRIGRELRFALFKTKQGRYYRIIFEITDSEVFILRVRRPGQRPLRKRDLPIP